jgi:hypothetical protein
MFPNGNIFLIAMRLWLFFKRGAERRSKRKTTNFLTIKGVRLVPHTFSFKVLLPKPLEGMALSFV